MTTLRTVWVTGVGAISAAGDGASALWNAVLSGRPLTRGLPRAGLDGPARSGGFVDVDFAADLPRSVRGSVDRSGQLLLAAGSRAWHDAGLDVASVLDPESVGVFAGSSVGPLGAVLDAHEAWRRARRVGPRDVVRCGAGTAVATLAAQLGALGPVSGHAGGSVSSTCAIGEAWLHVAGGLLEVCVAGGGEAPLHPGVLELFGVARILADGGPENCRPFDRRRRGTHLGEAGAALVLETEEHAKRRGARPYAELAGYANAGDGAADFVAPNPEGAGLARAIRAALLQAGVDPDAVDYVQLHGTGTRLNDAAEARALEAVFGAGRGATVPAAATKPVTGHCLGACGALETVVALHAMREGCAPPTANLGEPDPEARTGVSEHVRDVVVRVALVNNSGFGGRNAALVLKSV